MTHPRSPSSVLMAPGAGDSPRVYAPGRNDPRPAVDERLVAPESHAEIVDGRVYRTMGANEPHAVEHLRLARVLGDCLAEGYEGAVDMLTRTSEDTDAAPDVSIFRAGTDPATGGRRLEELAFEVLDTERMSHTTDKVEKLAARGVRRLFAIRVASRVVYEWSHEHHDWEALDPTHELRDVCFRVPIPAAALVDRVLADDTVARALLAGTNRVLAEALAATRSEGHKEGHEEGQALGALRARRELVLEVLGARGSVTEGQRARVMECADSPSLDAWFRRALAGEDALAILGA